MDTRRADGSSFTVSIFISSTILAVALAPLLDGQVLLTGRLRAERAPGSGSYFPLAGVTACASLDGSASEPLLFRSWETEPAGWYRLSGSPGVYTLVFSQPAGLLRPIVLTNIFARDGETIERVVSPAFDLAMLEEASWDPRPARAYLQPFVAGGPSVTRVGFRLAHDGVDGFGPGKQDLLVSIRRPNQKDPESWEAIGPVIPVIDVDSGGGKNYVWSVSWNSEEVPVTPGEIYAVRIEAEKPGGVFQAFWRDGAAPAGKLRRGDTGAFSEENRQLWLMVACDGDGLVIPYSKRVHKEFTSLTRFARRWSQTYRARGRSLASVALYAATGGTQPPLSRQRVVVRVRRGGPRGPVAGVEKIACGNGNYTGDASWGLFALAYAPGEVALEPGELYAIEWESIEGPETIAGFVDLKGRTSDARPGFNPYRKHPRDAYAEGTAFLNGEEAMDYDLDLEIVEYERRGSRWREAVDRMNLLKDGDVEDAAPGAWKEWSLLPGTEHLRAAEIPDGKNHLLRLQGPGGGKEPSDGGWVQRVEGLNPLETYRFAARVRASWALDADHRTSLGIDPTGQSDNAGAETIVWRSLPAIHGQWVDHAGGPVRPRAGALSVWLRGRSTKKNEVQPYRADFDDLSLRRVRTGAPDED